MVGYFEVTDLRSISYFLGIEVDQREDGIFISQKTKNYNDDILKIFKMDKIKPIMSPNRKEIEVDKRWH